jgi:HSP20 family protein
MLARINRNYVPASPAVNVIEDEQGFRIEVSAPGVQRDDFNLEVENDVLTISTGQEESKDEQKQNFLRREFNFRTFKRSFQLPESVDQEEISATHDAGILTLSLPKKEEEVQKAARQIAVK